MAAASFNSLAKQDNEETYLELRGRLHMEIAALKKILIHVNKDTTKSVDIIIQNSRNVIDVLQTIIDKKLDNREQACLSSTADSQFPNPIHDLLSVGSLNRIEIPLDVIKMMITAGFDMNSMDNSGILRISHATCLFRAIQYRQFNVVKFLVSQNAKCQERTKVEHFTFDETPPPIVLLASQQSVPSELFDMPATPHDLTRALFAAVLVSNHKTAQYLIKLGASVDTADKYSLLPIGYFVDKYAFGTRLTTVRSVTSEEINAEHFLCLLPRSAHGLNLFKIICVILTFPSFQNHLAFLEMLHSLIQRLDFLKLIMSMCFKPSVSSMLNIEFYINDERIVCYSMRPDAISLLGLYLFHLMLTEAEFDVISVPNDIVPLVAGGAPGNDELMQYAHAVDDLWRTYQQKCRVKSLLRLCILKTRKSMCSLADYSFRSLPVPPYIRKLLAYRDVSERIYEEFCNRTAKSDSQLQK